MGLEKTTINRESRRPIRRREMGQFLLKAYQVKEGHIPAFEFSSAQDKAPIRVTPANAVTLMDKVTKWCQRDYPEYPMRRITDEIREQVLDKEYEGLLAVANGETEGALFKNLDGTAAVIVARQTPDEDIIQTGINQAVSFLQAHGLAERMAYFERPATPEEAADRFEKLYGEFKV